MRSCVPECKPWLILDNVESANVGMLLILVRDSICIILRQHAEIFLTWPRPGTTSPRPWIRIWTRCHAKWYSKLNSLLLWKDYFNITYTRNSLLRRDKPCKDKVCFRHCARTAHALNLFKHLQLQCEWFLDQEICNITKITWQKTV